MIYSLKIKKSPVDIVYLTGDSLYFMLQTLQTYRPEQVTGRYGSDILNILLREDPEAGTGQL